MGRRRQETGWQLRPPGVASSLHKVLIGNQEYSKVPSCTDPGMDVVQLRPCIEQIAGLVFNSSIKLAVIWHWLAVLVLKEKEDWNSMWSAKQFLPLDNTFLEANCAYK